MQPLELDPEDYRPDFPVLSTVLENGNPLVYLDNAASTQRPRRVINAMSDCFERYYANVHRGIHTLSETSTDHYERARSTAARFLNAQSNREIVFTSGTTSAINLVARTWGDANVGPDDIILLTIMEHHANIVPWHQLAERTGCHVLFAPLSNNGQIDTERLTDLIDQHAGRIKIFAFTALSNVLGTINPVTAWTKAAQAAGAIVLVDAAQAAPHQPIDVQTWNADFVTFSGHKLCGPTGIGVLYGRESILQQMPPFLGGGAMIRSVTTEGFTTADLPEKFEAGTPPIVEAIGLDAALQYLQNIGLGKIHQYENQLLQRAESGLRQIEGVTLLNPSVDPKGGIASFVIDNVHAHDIAHWLNHHGIAVRAGHHCAMPLHHDLGIAASTRASFYFYNTVPEIDRLLEAVKSVRDKFAPSGRKRKTKT